MKINRAILLTLLLSALPATVPAATFNLASDFSASANPAGVWSYGYSTTLGGTFNLYTANGTANGMDYWGAPGAGLTPGVFHNGTSTTTTLAGVSYAPGETGFHPGPSGEFSIFRFTAPSAGSYSLSASFSLGDVGGTDVHVLRNGVSLFDGLVNPSNQTASFTSQQTLLSGNTIDFVLGVGPDGSYTSDSTKVAGTLTTGPASMVPEPSTWAMVGGAGVLGLIAIRRRRSQASSQSAL